MNRLLCAVLLFSLSIPAIVHAQGKPPSQYQIQDDLDKLKPVLAGMPGPDGKPMKPLTDDERAAKISALAAEIKAFPAGSKKVNFALELAQLSTAGDPHKETIQAVTDTLSAALTETPTAGKKGKPAPAYMELARLVHYAGMTTTVTDPQLAEAQAILTANDADVAKADFTLIDLSNKKVTLSALRGKIVLVNFFSLNCPNCLTEMTNLNLIYQHYQSQGLVILSITDDDIQPGPARLCLRQPQQHHLPHPLRPPPPGLRSLPRREQTPRLRLRPRRQTHRPVHRHADPATDLPDARPRRPQTAVAIHSSNGKIAPRINFP